MKMSVTEFKATCTKVLRDVAAHPHRSVEITNHGKVIAIVSPPPSAKKPDPKEFWGSLAGTVTYVGDIVSPAVDEKDWEACR